MEELRIAFLVIGVVLIGGILAHGIWKMRRQSIVPEREEQRIEPVADSLKNEDGFDEFGIGNVRVVSGEQNNPHADESETSVHDFDSEGTSNELPEETHSELHTGPSEEQALDDIPSLSDESDIPVVESQPEQPHQEPPMYASVVTQPKPHMTETNQGDKETVKQADIPDPPTFLLKETAAEAQEPDFGLSTPPAAETRAPVTEEVKKPVKKAAKKRSSARKRKEPTLGEDQMRIDFDEPEVVSITDSAEPVSAETTPQTTEVLAINVRALEQQALSGAALLPMLLTLGFKFGEHDIFHRHVNANGKGPVLFSLANMVKPGVFDIDNLETFTTQGITLFMVLPIEGDPHQVFNMMHNAARKIADEFNAQLLDGRRSILTKQGIQQYVEKIREFERQRIISNSAR